MHTIIINKKNIVIKLEVSNYHKIPSIYPSIQPKHVQYACYLIAYLVRWKRGSMRGESGKIERK